MTVRAKPARWQGSDDAIRAVQVAFDVEEAVLEAVRKAAFDRHVSTSDQIRQVLGLTTTAGPKRPRLTVSLGAADYEFLAARYGLAADDRLAIKERATRDLIAFAGGGKAAAKSTTKNAMKSTAKSAAKSAPEGVKQSARTGKPARR